MHTQQIGAHPILRDNIELSIVRPDPPSANLVISIQVLRGFAALAVVILHLYPQMERMGLERQLPPSLAAGVDVFFVISGFIMWVTTADKQTGPREFILNRIVRIVPLYWVITLFLVSTLLVAPSIFQSSVFDPRHAGMSFLFLPYPNAQGQLWPVLIPGWTLNYEMFFYAIFAGILIVRNTTGRWAILSIVLTMIACSSLVIHSENLFFRFYSNPIVLEFAIGVFIAVVYRAKVLRPSNAWLLLTALGILLLSIPVIEGPRLMVWGMPSGLVVAGAVFARPMRLNWLSSLGDTSYSLYLSHPIVLSALGQIWRWLALPLEWFPAAAIPAAIIGGVFVYRFLERPMTRSLKKREHRILGTDTGIPSVSGVPEVRGIRFSKLTLRDLRDQILAGSTPGAGTRLVVTANVDHINQLERNAMFREAYDAAWVRTVDGFPVFALLRFKGFGEVVRVTGAALCAEIVPKLRSGQHRPFYVVSSAATAGRLRESHLHAGFSEESLGFEVPPLGFDQDLEFGIELARKIRAHRATHLFFGVGAPKSEIWLYQHRDQLGDLIAMSFGAGLDFVVGTAVRAPLALQRLGLEWAWRLAHEPRRLFSRYVFGAFVFARIAFSEMRG